MEMDAALPTGICRSCSQDTVAAITFRNLCTQSSQNWMEATTYLSQIHPPTPEDKAYFIFCTDEKTIIKDQVDRVPTKTAALERLNLRYQDKPEKTKKPKRPHDPNAACSCPDCGKRFSMPDYLNFHLRNTLKRACTHCGVVLNKRKIADHMSVEHNIIVANCNICFKLLENENDLIRHLKESHGDNTHGCHVCGISYSNERALRAHLYSHSLFHCKSCNLSFENIKCYKYHQKQCKIVDGPVFKNFTCDICGVTYNRKPSLRIHIVQKHLNVLPYVCQTCGKRTSTLAHLRSHEKVHKTERKIFQCYCGAKLRTELGYQLHQRIHTGERPYECQYCGDRFLSSSRRLDHVKRRHRGSKEMPHACEQCSARFVRPCELKKHYLTVHYTVMDVLPAKREINPVTRRLRNTIEKQFIKEEPLIPVGACVACASKALAAQEFRLFVRNSQKSWWKAIQNLALLPFSATPTVKSMCAFVKPSDLSIQTYKDYTQGDAKSILNRLKNRVTKKPIERKPRGARSGPSCSCPDCGKSFFSPYFLNMHLKNSGHKEACQICGSVVVRGTEMKEHLASIHNETAFLCKQCPLLFTNDVQLKKHVKKAHKAGALTCSDCGRTFPRQASFETHSQMHAVRTCRACGVQFTNRGCYREHRAQCEPDAKPNAQSFPRNRRSNIRDPAQFTCDHCGKTYNSRPQLKNHIIWIHMNIRPHQCQWCGKRFYTPARLAEHTVVHTRVRNFGCDLCGAKLVSKMAAVYHRRRHTGERPYECEDCGEKFISASRRSEHAKRRHNKGYRLPCLKCPASFVRKHELKKHMEKAHVAQDTILPW